MFSIDKKCAEDKVRYIHNDADYSTTTSPCVFCYDFLLGGLEQVL